jgi:hypothetical protein
MKEDKSCKNCKFWQNYKNRVYARLKISFNTARQNGLYELRPCEWHPHPSVATAQDDIYTDEDFCCQEWRQE